ncbi:UNVERIFIED_CONTAM: hypothetical protein GTU68_038977 [Idotea baltica]|nr:hypothetical protein [Idotea baltica]
MPNDNSLNWQPTWQPTWHSSALQIRSIALRTIREFFQSRDYVEVTTPVISHDIVVDAHLHPFTVKDAGSENADSKDPLYLQTSPEAAMKRLLAAGSGSIFQICPVFRSAERGSRHNPEFTMVEWYGVGTNDADQMQLTEDLVIAVQASINEFSTSYEAAFESLAPESILQISNRSLRELCEKKCQLQLPENIERDDLLNLLLAEGVERNLGTPTPEFLHSYPISQAALAVACDDDSRTARRFELYINGLELCNGYHELTDSDELVRRAAIENQRRESHAAEQLPGAPRLEAAMQHGLPECSGVALGFERLLMALLGADDIQHVLSFPIEIA